MDYKVANRLVELRKKNGYSQEELADKLGVSRQAISNWERAETLPDTENLIALAGLYGITLDEVVHGDKPRATEKITAQHRELKPTQGNNKKSVVEKYIRLGIMIGSWGGMILGGLLLIAGIFIAAISAPTPVPPPPVPPTSITVQATITHIGGPTLASFDLTYFTWQVVYDFKWNSPDNLNVDNIQTIQAVRTVRFSVPLTDSRPWDEIGQPYTGSIGDIVNITVSAEPERPTSVDANNVYDFIEMRGNADWNHVFSINQDWENNYQNYLNSKNRGMAGYFLIPAGVIMFGVGIFLKVYFKDELSPSH